MKQCTECSSNFEPSNNRQLACSNCKSIRELRIKRERRESDPLFRERARFATRKHRNANREAVRARGRELYAKNKEQRRDKINAQSRARFAKSESLRAKRKEYMAKYQEKYGEILNTKRREQYINDLDRQRQCKEAASRWARANPELRREKELKWRANNPDKVFANNLKNRRVPIQELVDVKSIYEQCDYTCQYCGRRGGKLSIDHITPICRGGKSDPDNLTIACSGKGGCNHRKGRKTLIEFLFWKAAREAELQPC